MFGNPHMPPKEMSTFPGSSTFHHEEHAKLPVSIAKGAISDLQHFAGGAKNKFPDLVVLLLPVA